MTSIRFRTYKNLIYLVPLNFDEVFLTNLHQLKKLSLNQSFIKRIHDIDTAINLQVIDLQDTRSLEEISLSHLNKLSSLRLKSSSIKKINLSDLNSLNADRFRRHEKTGRNYPKEYGEINLS